MSEIKGQILGVVLVIVLFGIISVAMKSAFDVYKGKINDAVTETVGPQAGANDGN